MFWFGTFLVAIAGGLFVLFGRQYLEGGGHYPINLDELFFWAQWIAFWLTLASLGLFALNAWSRGFGGPSWRVLPPAIAIFMTAHFFVATMPEKSNRDRWVKGALGLKVYVETKWRQREEQQAERKMRNYFTGDWQTTQGARLKIAPESIVLTLNGSDLKLGEAGGRYYTWEPPARLHYLFARTGMVNSPLRRNLADREYPQLSATCDSRESVFVLLEPKRLLAVAYDGTALILSRE